MSRLVSVLRPSLLFFALTSLARPAFAQDVDSARARTTLAGLVTVTNKGISTIVAKRSFPLSIGSQVNRTLRTTIIEGDDLIWNVSVSYSIR
jgi:hypothetical protein